MTLTFFALSANFNEESVSSLVPTSAETFTIIDVLNLPDNESLRILVNFESLKGT